MRLAALWASDAYRAGIGKIWSNHRKASHVCPHGAEKAPYALLSALAEKSAWVDIEHLWGVSTPIPGRLPAKSRLIPAEHPEMMT